MSDRTDWLLWRRQGVGASDVAAILGLSNWSSPWKVWAEKTQLLPLDDGMSDRQQMGLDLEPVIAKMFERETGLVVAGEQTWCASPSDPWARCTVDGFVFEQERPTQLGVNDAIAGYEAKSDGRFGWPDGIPANYQAQAQFGMFVTGLPKWYFAVLHANFKFMVYELHRDQEDIDFMVERVRAFWEQHVLTGTPPEADGSDATWDALNKVYGDVHTGERADITAVADELDRWRAGVDVRKAAKAQEDDAKAKLMAAIGPAELGCIDGVPVVSLRPQTKKDTCRSCGHVRESEPFRVMRLASKKDLKETA